jgi:hypothetical protein
MDQDKEYQYLSAKKNGKEIVLRYHNSWAEYAFDYLHEKGFKCEPSIAWCYNKMINIYGDPVSVFDLEKDDTEFNVEILIP